MQNMRQHVCLFVYCEWSVMCVYFIICVGNSIWENCLELFKDFFSMKSNAPNYLGRIEFFNGFFQRKKLHLSKNMKSIENNDEISRILDLSIQTANDLP